MIVGGRIAAHSGLPAASVSPRSPWSTPEASACSTMCSGIASSISFCAPKHLERLVIGYRHPGQVDEASARWTLDV